MSFTLVPHPNAASVVVTLQADFDPTTATADIARQFASAVTQFDAQVFLIIDFRAALNQASLNNLMSGSFLATQQDNPLFHHQRVNQVLFVAVSDIMERVAEGLNSKAFGHLQVQVFPDLESALDYARTNA